MDASEPRFSANHGLRRALVQVRVGEKALRLLGAAPSDTGVVVTWESVAGVNYSLERSTNLAAAPGFLPLATNVSGQPGTTAFTDTTPSGQNPLFYRVGVAP